MNNDPFPKAEKGKPFFDFSNPQEGKILPSGMPLFSFEKGLRLLKL